MKHLTSRKTLAALAVVATVGLTAGCSDNDDDDIGTPPGTANEVPASATVTTKDYVTYIGTLAKSETALPLSLDKVVKPPTSETEAPQAI